MKKTLQFLALTVILLLTLTAFVSCNEPNVYTVTFENCGTSAIPEQKVNEGELATEPPTPLWEGYAFVGWDYDFSEPISGDTTISAIWEPTAYTISYALNEGINAAENPATYTVEESVTLADPTRLGYTFLGWTGEGIVEPVKGVKIEKGTTGNRTYTANWVADEYTISYELNNGINAGSNPSSYRADSETITLSDPTKSDYEFLGWTGEGIETPTKNVKIKKGSTGDRTYTAIWQIITYNVTYQLNGGTNKEENPATYTVEMGFTLAKPEKKGYNFLGWTYEGQTEPQKEVTVVIGSTGDRTYTANWEIITFQITYKAETGSEFPQGAEIPTSYTVETPTFTLVNPIRKGYTFAGWTYLFFTTPMKEVTIQKGMWTGDYEFTAHWTVNTYTIGYDLQEGTVEGTNPTTYTVESENITLVNPTRLGYTFTGWTGTGITEPTLNLTIAKGTLAENLSFTANWELTTYHIHYLGVDSTENPTTYNIETEDFTLTEPTRAGVVFVGWRDGNNNDPQKSVTISKGSTGDRTYTAVWENSYSITYEGVNEGENDPDNPSDYTEKDADITLKDPTRAGYTFLGWTFAGQITPIKEAVIYSGSIGNLTFTANWEAITYTITYELDGGKLPEGPSNPIAYTVETETFTLVNPTRGSDNFSGWLLEGETTVQKTVTVEKGSTGNRTYQAIWVFEVQEDDPNAGWGPLTPMGK